MTPRDVSAESSVEPERLSPADSARWHMGTPENPMVIGALLLFERPLALAALEDLIREKLISHRRFRQHVVESGHRLSRPCWRDDAAFDLSEHVRQLAGPVPRAGNGATWADRATLATLADERINTPLPPGRSPWSFELVDLAPTGSALLVRIHHSIADGQALVALLGQLADERIGPERRATPAATAEMARPRHFFGQLGGLLRFLALRRDPPGLLRRPLAGRKGTAWSEPIPLEVIKRLASARGHHVADVLLAGVAGALDRYERDHGQLPRSVRTLLPVALPSKDPAGGLGNHYASVFVRLPLDLADPQQRLEAIARDMAAVRSGGQSRMAVGLIRLAGAVAPSIERWAVRRWSRRASLVVSSLAGPTVPLHIAGQPLEAIIIWAPSPASVGLSLTCFGYAGALRLGVLADRGVIDRPEALAAGFEAAIDELARGAEIARGAPPEGA